MRHRESLNETKKNIINSGYKRDFTWRLCGPHTYSKRTRYERIRNYFPTTQYGRHQYSYTSIWYRYWP